MGRLGIQVVYRVKIEWYLSNITRLGLLFFVIPLTFHIVFDFPHPPVILFTNHNNVGTHESDRGLPPYETLRQPRRPQRHHLLRTGRRDLWIPGPNGAGKTTTIRILTGITVPTGGDAQIFGRDIVKDTIAARRTMGSCTRRRTSIPISARGRT